MKMNRGGKSLKVGDIGRFNVLRQHLLLPGERMNTSLKGNVRLSGLRQQTSVYLHAQIDAFAAPLRWFYSDFPDYLQEGIATVKTIPTLTGATWTADRPRTSNLGIGNISFDFAKWYAQMPISVWNEWYRWPENAKVSVDTPPISFFDAKGKECVNLASAATRIHDAPALDALEYQVPAATVLDVRDLSLWQARFSQAAKTDWTSQERYNVFMRDVFNARGSNEVDQVPIRLKKGAELSVMPRDMYATDGASLGELMSISNFQVSHSWDDFIASEHMIVCYIMLLRFAPIMEDGVAPGIYPNHAGYTYFQGDPNIIGAQRPQLVATREIDGSGGAGTIGYLPQGWEWREGFTHVDWHISDLGNFPLLDQQPLTADGYRDATKINQSAFRSTALRHYYADLDFNISVQGRIPDAGTSIMAGGKGSAKPKGNHPTGGNVM